MLEMLYDFNVWLGDSFIVQIVLVFGVGYLGYKHVMDSKK
jgi:hypothetical protein